MSLFRLQYKTREFIPDGTISNPLDLMGPKEVVDAVSDKKMTIGWSLRRPDANFMRQKAANCGLLLDTSESLEPGVIVDRQLVMERLQRGGWNELSSFAIKSSLTPPNVSETELNIETAARIRFSAGS